jgi:N utilization substance protein B
VKSKYDPRHLNRIRNIQAIFALECGGNPPEDSDISSIIPKFEEIDAIIQENAPKWPLDKINKVDLSILRYALWELIYKKDNPSKVIIDEAIEIAKEFGTESSPSFVNGVIGSAVKKIQLSDLE